VHAKPHAVPSHVVVARATTMQGVQAVGPHDVVLRSLTHAPAQRWNPALQTNPHEVPLHVAEASAGIGQAVHAVEPQLAVLASDTHTPPQR